MYYYHHYHFIDDTGRLSDQDGIVGGQMEMQRRMFSSIPGLYPPDSRSTLPPLQVLTTITSLDTLVSIGLGYSYQTIKFMKILTYVFNHHFMPMPSIVLGFSGYLIF